MPSACCVFGCSNNSNKDNKLSFFRFTKNPELRQKWLQFIRRNDFVPSCNSRVCELHFKTDCIIRSREFRIESTGELITVPLKKPCLSPGAVPSLEDGIDNNLSETETPNNLSETETTNNLSETETPNNLSETESPASKIIRLKNLNTEKYVQEQKFGIDFIYCKFKDRDIQGWTLIMKNSQICFVYLIMAEKPSVECIVRINKKMEVTVFYKDITMRIIGKFAFPLIIKTVDVLEEILKIVLGFLETERQMDQTRLNKTAVKDKINLGVNILDSISDLLPHKVKSIE